MCKQRKDLTTHMGLKLKENGDGTMEENNNVHQDTKFCKECGQRIARKAVICPHCGCQTEEASSASAQPQIVINNSNQNQNQNINAGMPYGANLKNKWVSFFLCLFLGYFGAHKFYEGRAGLGLLYLFTGGLFFIGCFIDLLSLLAKPNPYAVY